MLHDQTNEIKNRHKQRHETYEIEHELKARRAQGGKGPLSQSISVQNISRNHPPKTTPRDEKEGTREREGEQGDGARRRSGRLGLAVWCQRRERGDGGIYGSHAEVQNTPRLKLETKMPVGAKPEIFT